MKVYVGLEGEGPRSLYLLSRKPFVVSEGYLVSHDKDGEVAVCQAVWRRLGGIRLKPFESRCIDLTLTIKPIKKGA